MRSSSFVSLATLAVMATLSPHALACWGEAGQRYGVSADLLYAIARVESNLNPKAVNRSHFQRTGSYDIGLMQINNRHLSVLSRHGIRESDLFDPCTNIQVGAAACSQLKGKACARARAQYAWRVYHQLPAQRSSQFVRAPNVVKPAASGEMLAMMSVRVTP